MRLSPTAVIQYETCPQHYYLEQVLRIKPRYPAANLVFGRVVHQVLETWMRSWMSGQPLDASAAFQTGWTQARAEGGIEYSATQSPESLQETGKALVAQFAAAWPGTLMTSATLSSSMGGYSSSACTVRMLMRSEKRCKVDAGMSCACFFSTRIWRAMDAA